jgi:predicted hydrocarbon binding protein
MDADKRKYKFSWDVIGAGTELSRPSLGENTTLEVYRLFQFTLRDVLEQRYGTEATDDIFRQAGVVAGKAFYEKYCSDVTDINTLAKTIQDRFRELAIGIVRFEKVDLENMVIQLTVDEDLDCSGLPDTSEQICVYDEGLIQGILLGFTGKEFTVREIDCWCSGERTCRFRASLAK